MVYVECVICGHEGEANEFKDQFENTRYCCEECGAEEKHLNEID